MPQQPFSWHAPAVSMPKFLKKASLFGQLAAVCLPLLAIIFALVFFSTRTAIYSAVADSVARNSRIQANAISLALEQVLHEMRNEILVLAGGSMRKETMMQRMQYRARVEDFRLRELAFKSMDPAESYLLINIDGRVSVIDTAQVEALPNSPFRTPTNLHLPDEVVISAPTEVVYTLPPAAGSVQSQVTVSVLRFSTPIFKDDGTFSGVLTISVDLATLRQTISNFVATAPGHTDADTGLDAVFVDREGWMIFQSEDQANQAKPLRLDAVRSGFRGVFGRQGFAGAFKPTEDYTTYWHIVHEINAGHSGQIISKDSDSWTTGSLHADMISFEPVNYQSSAGEASKVIAGVIVLDSDHEVSNRCTSIYFTCAISFIASFVGLIFILWIASRIFTLPLRRLRAAITDASEKSTTDVIPSVDEPKEVAEVRTSVNLLIERLRAVEMEMDTHDKKMNFLRQQETIDSLPRSFEAPEDGIIGTSKELARLRESILQAAKSPDDVLVIGETGTGKELVSRAIHMESNRRDGPFITINCGALDEGLLMDTLFGHVKGAYTEARQARKGAFIAANGGTLMLDEIGTASLRVQQALLRALSDRCIHPLGSDSFVQFDTRVIAATNADLREDSAKGRFREDLFFRLAVITIHTPPLRQHKEDIPYMLVAFMKEALIRAGVDEPLPDITRGAMTSIMHYHWPGNVREFRNCIFRAMACCSGHIIEQKHLQFVSAAEHPTTADVAWSENPGPEIHSQQDKKKDAAKPASFAGEEESMDSPAPKEPHPATPASPAGSRRKAAEEPDTMASPVKQEKPDFHEAEARQPQKAADAGTESDGARPARARHTRETGGSLNARLMGLLPQIAERPSLTRSDYETLANGLISARTAQYDLQILVDMGVLTKQGRGAALRYSVDTERALQIIRERGL